MQGILLIRELREAGVLVDDSTQQEVRPNDGVIVCFCGDGQRSRDKFFQQCKHSDRPHLVALNGGPMAISKRSPLHENRGATWLEEIAGALALGKGRVINLYTHYPCGIARLNNLTAIDCIEHILDARLAVILAHPEVIVNCFLHADYEEVMGKDSACKMRTYGIDRQQWNLWAQANGRRPIGLGQETSVFRVINPAAWAS